MKKFIFLILTLSAILLVGCDLNENSENNNISGNQQQNENIENNINIKELLASSGLFKIKSAYDSTTENDYLKYWGTSYRYGGGVEFFDNDTFFYSVGIWAETDDREGTYSIDMNNNKIIYKYNNGRVLEGTYTLENEKITEVTYIDYNEEDPIYVTLRASTAEEILERKIENSFIDEWQFENATIDGEKYEIDYNSNWNPMFYDFKFPNNDNIIIDDTPEYTYKIDTKEHKILFNIVTKNHEVPLAEVLKNASSYFYYELDENDEIVRVTYVENENKNDELRINFIRSII